jgi:hypothetical protein
VSADQTAGAYEPRPGDRVTVRRYQQPTLTPGDPERKLTFQFTGTVTKRSQKGNIAFLRFDSDDVVLQYDDDGHRSPDLFDLVCLDYVFVNPGYLVTEVVPAGTVPGEAFRVQVTPDMAVVVDPSQCVVLEVTDRAGGPVLRRVTVTGIGHFKAVLDAAREAQEAELGKSDRRRAAGLAEARRGRGILTQYEAVEWLIRTGPVSRQRAVNLVNELSAGAPGGSRALGMTYAGGYWRVPVQQKP